MCGIAGAIGKNASLSKKVKEMLNTLKHRGPDGFGVYKSDNLAIGNTLLRITGNKPQPIYNKKFALTFNGEIYNFLDIAKELKINTDSDSETLFHLINQYGVENALHKIDGDYAFAYATPNKLILARDTIGVKPLYYGFNNIFAFASEKKALWKIGIKEIKAHKPGNILIIDLNTLELCEKKVTQIPISDKLIYSEEIAYELLSMALRNAVEKRLKEINKIGIAFSGGLDSSLIVAIAKQLINKNNIKLYCVGMENSHDIKQAKIAAKLLEMEDQLSIKEINKEELKSTIPKVINAMDLNPIDRTRPTSLGFISIGVPLYIAAIQAHADGIKVMLSGQGADELFAGYHRYLQINNTENLQKDIIKDLHNISNANLERDDMVTSANSVELRVPYLDMDVIKIGLQIAPELKINKKKKNRKYILRKVAEKIMPPEIAWKEKKAMQYGTGVHKAIKRFI